MHIQHISSETKKLIARLNPIYNSFSEMTPSEQEFLTDIVRQYKPKKLLELGIASGSSSVLLLNAIQDIPNSHLTSIDYSTPYYRDKTKNSGFVVDEYPDLKQKWTLYTGGMASEFMEKVGGDIDFCFIDTMHSLPGEVIDFLLVLPYLKPNAVIVFHDTNLQTWGNWPQCTSNNMLVSAISGEKIVPETFENVFFHNTLKKDFQMYFPNITGIILDGTQKDKIWDIFNLLTQKWKYILKSEDITSIKISLEKHYSEFYVKMFDNILNYQMNMAKDDKTIQDIIRENKELIDKRLQDECKAFKTLSEEQNSLIIKNIENTTQQVKHTEEVVSDKIKQANSNLYNLLQDFSDKTMPQAEILNSINKIQRDIIQQTKEQNDSYVSLLKQSENALTTNQNELLSGISVEFKNVNNSLLEKWQKLEDKQQQAVSFEEEKFNYITSNIQKLGDNIGTLHQELNNDVILSHQNTEMLEQKIITIQNTIEQKQKEFLMPLSELKMYVNASVIKKRYWYYKIMRWSPIPAKRKKYREKYNKTKPLYKKIMGLEYDF